MKTFKEGPLAFYKGFQANAGRIVSWNIVMFVSLGIIRKQVYERFYKYWSWNLYRKFIIISWLIIKIIVFVSFWLVFNCLPLLLILIFSLNSLLELFGHYLTEWLFGLACDDVKAAVILFHNVPRPDIPVNFFGLIIVFQLVATIRFLVCLSNRVVANPKSQKIIPISISFVFE